MKKTALIGSLLMMFFGIVMLTGELTGNRLLASDIQNAAPTFVIDAGHGGFDGGAVGVDGIAEKDINLKISDKLNTLYRFFGWKTVMTRETDEALDFDPSRPIRANKVADIKAREKIAKNAQEPVFISVHLNKYEDAKYYGAQTFYSRNHQEGKNLAEAIQGALLAGIPNGNIRRAKVAPESVYLMRKLECPAVIVECGFLSNAEEAPRLEEDSYQKQLAVCIFSGSMEFVNKTVSCITEEA